MGYTNEEKEILKDAGVKTINEKNLDKITESLLDAYDSGIENTPNLISEVVDKTSDMINKYIGIISKTVDSSDEETKQILEMYQERLKTLSEELLNVDLSYETRLLNMQEATEIRESVRDIKRDQDKHRIKIISVIGSTIITVALGAIGILSNNSSNDDDTIDTSFKE